MCSTELRPEFGHQVSDCGRGVWRIVTGLDWAALSSPAPPLPGIPSAPIQYGAAGRCWLEIEAGLHPIPAAPQCGGVSRGCYCCCSAA